MFVAYHPRPTIRLITQHGLEVTVIGAVGSSRFSLESYHLLLVSTLLAQFSLCTIDEENMGGGHVVRDLGETK